MRKVADAVVRGLVQVPKLGYTVARGADEQVAAELDGVDGATVTVERVLELQGLAGLVILVLVDGG